jgi:hypothetical protein
MIRPTWRVCGRVAPGAGRFWLTRRHGRDVEGEGRHVVMVEGFTRREGQRYLRGRLGPAVEAGEIVTHTFDEVDGLVRDLGGTPLALALAASVLRENRYTCAPTGLASWAALMIAVLSPAGVPAKIMTTEAVRRLLAARAARAKSSSASTTSLGPRGRWSRTAWSAAPGTTPGRS